MIILWSIDIPDCILYDGMKFIKSMPAPIDPKEMYQLYQLAAAVRSHVFHFSSGVSNMSLVVRKPVFGYSDQVRHKPGCTTTEDCWRLETLDLGSRGIVLSV